MPTFHSIYRCLLIMGLLSVLTACAEESTIAPPKKPTTSPMITTTPHNTESGDSGLTGQVTSYSDVSGQPDEPLPDQMVLAFPDEKVPEILGASSANLSDEELRFLKANLLEANPAIAVTLSDAAGKYTLHLDPGAYILCLADSDHIPPDFPARTRGCGNVVVAPGELKRVDISSGFGEILLIAK